jgi:hypothetical protein
MKFNLDNGTGRKAATFGIAALFLLPAAAQTFNHGDFNGDGQRDLAVTLAQSSHTPGFPGAVHIVYRGTYPPKTQTLNGSSFGQAFGTALAIGDFDGDGFSDLAIGAHNTGPNREGAVYLYYGSSTGLVARAGKTVVNQGDPAPYDYFGRVLAAGDLDGDTLDDLVVGVPSKDINGLQDSGAIYVYYGSRTTSSGWRDSRLYRRVWTQDTVAGSTAIAGMVEAGDAFGRALAIGDFNDDGYGDLAVGVPGEDVEDKKDAGAVNILYGSVTGLTAERNRIFWQGSTDVTGYRTPGTLEADDHFGMSLAAGKFRGTRHYGLAIGAPWETVAAVPKAGAVVVLYGSSTGLSCAHATLITRSSLSLAGPPVANSQFGYTLTSGTLTGVGYWDLAIGAPYEDIGGVAAAGAVYVVFGGYYAVNTSDAFRFTVAAVNSSVAADKVPGANDQFGWSVLIDSQYQTLTVGAPGRSSERGVLANFSGMGPQHPPGGSSFTKREQVGLNSDQTRFGHAIAHDAARRATAILARCRSCSRPLAGAL